MDMIDAYLAKDSLSIILPDRFDEDKRFYFEHPERIITTDNFADIALEFYPYFLMTRTARNLIWCREEITDSIACALYLHYVSALHQADLNARETSMQ